MACTLADVVLRRTEAGTAGSPGRAALERAARVVSPLLGWSRERANTEIEAVEARYRLA
jgi:glycerol-3-phosphate dehydrogenase